MNKKQKKVLIRIIISAVFFIAMHFFEDSLLITIILGSIGYLVVGYDIIFKAIRRIGKKDLFDENFLMVVATFGALALKNFEEAVEVMLFYQIGELFQSIAVGKSRKNISDLVNIKSDYANMVIDGQLQRVDVENVAVGSEIVVKVGEKIPLDGYIVKGSSSLNTASLTGEAKPKDVTVDDVVVSGCINMTSVITVKTTKDYENSTAAKILDLIENASSNKSKSEDFITKFSRYYTPVVCYCALALVIIPPLFNLLMSKDANWYQWFYRALTFLVISCPCALVISIPLSFFAGIGSASRMGILIKGSNHLEDLAQVKYVVFDKTGTMTKGIFEVEGVHHSPLSDQQLIEQAALAEIFSNHPIASCLKKEYGKYLDQSRVSSVYEISGQGIKAVIDGKNVLVGNELLMKENNIDYISCHCVGTIVHVSIDGQYMGHIVINDIIKPTSQKAISCLKKRGVLETVMLTGDQEKIALDVQKKLNIDKVYYQLLPADKVNKLEEILDRKQGKQKVSFVGDGINDAAVIARSDVGVAMGALGSDAAIEAADVVLMDDDPLKIASAMKIAKKTMLIVYENIYFAIIAKVLTLILGALGYSAMWMAILADVGVMVIAVINAIRALFIRGER